MYACVLADVIRVISDKQQKQQKYQNIYNKCYDYSPNKLTNNKHNNNCFVKNNTIIN